MIKSGTFVKVRNKKLGEHGINYGDVVYVASLAPFPIKQSDQYTLRVKLFIHKLDGDDIDTKSGIFVIDPRSVKELSEEDNAIYLQKVEAVRIPENTDESEAIATTY